jgi:hypothetical protein
MKNQIIKIKNKRSKNNYGICGILSQITDVVHFNQSKKIKKMKKKKSELFKTMTLLFGNRTPLNLKYRPLSFAIKLTLKTILQYKRETLSTLKANSVHLTFKY